MSEKQYISSYPDLLSEWDWKKNDSNGIYPDDISIGSVRKVHWKCSLGHSWEATPNNRSRGQGCPVCAGRKILIGYNDLASKHPKVSADWHPVKNDGLMPTQVTAGSNKKVWWLCNECGNEWQTSVANRVAGKGCPICGRKKQGLAKEQRLVAQKGSFALHYPQLLEEWDYEKNTVDPQEITKDSTRRVWWKCSTCGHSWATTVSHRTIRGSGCPACKNKVIMTYAMADKNHFFKQVFDIENGDSIDLFWCVVAKHNIRTQNRIVPVIDLKRIEELFTSYSLNTVFHCIRNHEYEIRLPEDVSITHQEIDYAGFKFKIPALCIGNLQE